MFILQRGKKYAKVVTTPLPSGGEQRNFVATENRDEATVFTGTEDAKTMRAVIRKGGWHKVTVK